MVFERSHYTTSPPMNWVSSWNRTMATDLSTVMVQVRLSVTKMAKSFRNRHSWQDTSAAAQERLSWGNSKTKCMVEHSGCGLQVWRHVKWTWSWGRLYACSFSRRARQTSHVLRATMSFSHFRLPIIFLAWVLLKYKFCKFLLSRTPIKRWK